MSLQHSIGSVFGFSNLSAIVRRQRAKRPAAVAQISVEALEDRTLLSQDWFVSPSGSNSNPGTLAAPFQTIQQAANHAQAGDTVMIEAGVYHETVTVPNSGTDSAPIVFEAYNNEPVTIDGADPITNWVKTGGSVWTAPMTWNLGAGNNQIFVDGRMINLARWPTGSLDVSHPAFSHVNSVTSVGDTVTVYEKYLTQPAGFWVGGTIQFGAGATWVMQGATITASGPGFVTFTSTPNDIYEELHAGNQFFLTGVAGALDAPGQWYLASNGMLSIWTPTGDSPANHVVEAKARQYAFDLSQVSNITIKNINIFAATIETSALSSHIVINHIVAQYLSQFAATSDGWTQPTDSGIMLAGYDDTLSNSVIAYSAGDGVFVTGNNSTVEDNIIHDTDYQGGNSAPVRINASYLTIDHNTIYDCAHDGIDLIAGHGEHITYNVIYDFGLQTTDVGGFYTYQTNGRGTEIAYNTIYDGVTGGFGGDAILLDEASSNYVIDHNITYDVNFGIKINLTGLGDIIVNNTLDATQNSIYKEWEPADWTGAVVENNIFTRSVLLGINATIQNNAMNARYALYFVDAAAGDFELVPGSPAIGAGVPMLPYTDAFTTTAPDLGALAYGKTPFSNGAVIANLPAVPTAAN